jgi:hypothetical protein
MTAMMENPTPAPHAARAAGFAPDAVRAIELARRVAETGGSIETLLAPLMRATGSCLATLDDAISQCPAVLAADEAWLRERVAYLLALARTLPLFD